MREQVWRKQEKHMKINIRISWSDPLPYVVPDNDNNEDQLFQWGNSSVGKESTCNAGDPGSILWRRDRLLTPVFLGFSGGSAGKESPAMRETWDGKIPWRRGRLPTLVFWPGEFHGLYSPWGCKELDTTEWLSPKKKKKRIKCKIHLRGIIATSFHEH